jgi:hypothetical protein
VKLGRNEPCHCGSGKKYKRCHLDDDRRRERIVADMRKVVDLASLRVVAAMTEPGFEAEYMAPADELNSSLRERIGDGLEGKDAAGLLAAYLEEVEAEMAQIASRHSRGYWMHLTRRMPPRPLGSATTWTVHLYRRVLTLAVLKHGAPETLDGEFSLIDNSLGPQQVPNRLDHADLVKAFALEYLSYEYIMATQAYRRVGKGARLHVVSDDFHAVPDTDDLEELMQTVDQRVDRYSELVSSSGMAGDRDFPAEPVEEGEAPLAILAAPPNVELRLGEEVSRYKVPLGGPANFCLAPLVIDGYREAFGTLHDEVVQATGVEPDVLIATIWGLAMRLVRGIEASPVVESQVLRVGYLMAPHENWDRVMDDVSYFFRILWAHLTGERLDETDARRYAARGVEALTWSDGAIASIRLWDRLPFKLIVDAGGFRVIDYGTFPEMFADLFHQVAEAAGRAGGGTKGANFEAAVAARARAEGFEPWMESRRLHHRDGPEREIDLGIVAGETLYVIECKARVRSIRIDRGDWSARLNRQETLIEDLEQARTLVEFLREEPVGADYEVPANVTSFEYLLCTPGAEFIWTREPELWVTDEIPRICTPDELILMLNAALVAS